jgi:hypothetical protein
MLWYFPVKNSKLPVFLWALNLLNGTSRKNYTLFLILISSSCQIFKVTCLFVAHLKTIETRFMKWSLELKVLSFLPFMKKKPPSYFGSVLNK